MRIENWGAGPVSPYLKTRSCNETEVADINTEDLSIARVVPGRALIRNPTETEPQKDTTSLVNRGCSAASRQCSAASAG